VEPLADARGTLGFCGTPVENYWLICYLCFWYYEWTCWLWLTVSERSHAACGQCCLSTSPYCYPHSLPFASGIITSEGIFQLIFYAFAIIMAGGIVFPECSCIRAFRTDIVSKISCVFVDGIWPNFHH